MALTDFQRMFGGHLLFVTKGEKDITPQFIDAISGKLTKAEALIPSHTEDSVQFVMSGVVEYFKNHTAEEIFQYQYNIVIKPVSGAGSTVSLSVIQGLPFLVFANSSVAQIPLGRQEFRSKYDEAIYFEKAVASAYILAITNANGEPYEIKKTQPTVYYDYLDNWYIRLGRNQDQLDEDINEAVRCGWAIEVEPDPYGDPYFDQYAIKTTNFSWHPSYTNEGV